MSDYLDLDTALQDGLLLSNYSQNIYEEIFGKAMLGFNVSTAVLWRERVSHSMELICRSVLSSMSDIPSFVNFTQGKSPMSIMMINEVIPEGLPRSASFAGALIPAPSAATNGTIYELTPFEASPLSRRLLVNHS